MWCGLQSLVKGNKHAIAVGKARHVVWSIRDRFAGVGKG
jgi:hypothetical protein